MNIQDAAYHTVHDYPGGSQSLAPRMNGMSPAVLRSKVNPNTTTHHLTLAEADLAMGLANDHRILQALAHGHGFLLVRAPSDDRPECDMAVLEQIAAFMVASGDFGQEIHAALADGRVTQDEIERIECAGRVAMERIAAIKERMKGIAEPATKSRRSID